MVRLWEFSDKRPTIFDTIFILTNHHACQHQDESLLERGLIPTYEHFAKKATRVVGIAQVQGQRNKFPIRPVTQRRVSYLTFSGPRATWFRAPRWYLYPDLNQLPCQTFAASTFVIPLDCILQMGSSSQKISKVTARKFPPPKKREKNTLLVP